MNNQTATINAVLEQLSIAVAAAKRADILIDLSFEGDYLYCVSTPTSLTRTINLNDTSAYFQLKACLNDVYAITPAKVATMQGAA